MKNAIASSPSPLPRRAGGIVPVLSAAALGLAACMQTASRNPSGQDGSRPGRRRKAGGRHIHHQLAAQFGGWKISSLVWTVDSVLKLSFFEGSNSRRNRLRPLSGKAWNAFTGLGHPLP